MLRRDPERGREQAVDDEDEADADDEGWLRNSWQTEIPDRSIAQQHVQGVNNEENDDDQKDEEEEAEEEDAFGDDFDEFAEGEEHEDFGDFDEPVKQTPSPLPTAPDVLSGLVSRYLFGEHHNAK